MERVKLEKKWGWIEYGVVPAALQAERASRSPFALS
jgi:hypothetical protein